MKFEEVKEIITLIQRLPREAVSAFSRGFQSTGRDHTIHPVASATIEMRATRIQSSLTRRAFVSHPLRAFQRTAKFIAPLRGREVAA
ncbi:MAG: hypothetical protein JST84_29765 [Acidobacteria bacterium]|nr:hypothetical protein [Acidobacteriota bacterium]